MYDQPEIFRKPARPKPAPRWPFVLIAALIVAAWSLNSGLKTAVTVAGADSGPAIAYAFGAGTASAFGQALLVFLLLYFGILHWLKTTRGFKEFGLLLLTAVVMNVAPTAVMSLAFRDAGDIGAMTRSYNVSVRQDAEEYFAAQEAGDLRRVLTPALLAQDPRLTQSKAIMVYARKTMERSHSIAVTRRQQVRDGVRARLAASGKDKAAQDKAVAAIDRKLAEVTLKDEKFWTLEAGILDEMDASVALLDRRRGRWQVADGRLTFASDVDAAAFNARLEKLDTLVAGQKSLYPAAAGASPQTAP